MGNEPSHMDEVQFGKRVVKRDMLPGHRVSFESDKWKDPVTCCWTFGENYWRVTLEDGQVVSWKVTQDDGCGCRGIVALGTKIVISIIYTPFWIANECGACDKKEEKKEEPAPAPAPAPAEPAVTMNPLNPPNTAEIAV